MSYRLEFSLDRLLYYLTGDDRFYWADDDRRPLQDWLRQALDKMLDSGILSPVVRERMKEKDAIYLAQNCISANEKEITFLSREISEYQRSFNRNYEIIKRNRSIIEEITNHPHNPQPEPPRPRSESWEKEREELIEKIKAELKRCQEEIERCEDENLYYEARISRCKDEIESCMREIRRCKVILD